MTVLGIVFLVLVNQGIKGDIEFLIENPHNQERINKLISYGPKAIPEITKQIDEVPVPTKISLVRALGKIGDTSATNILIKVSETESAQLKANIAHSLGEIKDKRALGRLIELISDVHDSPRGEAAWALGEIGDTSAIPALVSLTNDPVFTNRAKALIAIGKLNALSQLVDINKFITDPEPTVRISMALAIGNSGDTSYLGYLESLSRDKEPFVRIQAFNILGKFKTEYAKSLLVAGLHDSHEGVRMQIMESLINLKDPKLLPYIYKLKTDRSPSVRKRVNDLFEGLEPDFLLKGLTEVIGTADIPLKLRKEALTYLIENLDREKLITLILDAFPFWTRDEAINVINRKIVKGMTKEQVLLSLGEPSSTQKNPKTKAELWNYKSQNIKIIFVEGRVIK